MYNKKDMVDKINKDWMEDPRWKGICRKRYCLTLEIQIFRKIFRTILEGIRLVKGFSGNY